MNADRTVYARRYPVKVQEFARRLHERGYSYTEVYEAVKRRGFDPSWETVRQWCRPEWREAHNLKRRAVSPAKRERRRPWHIKWRRACELREAGLSFNAIAAVLRLDYGVELTDHQVRHLFRRRGANAPRLLG